MSCDQGCLAEPQDICELGLVHKVSQQAFEGVPMSKVLVDREVLEQVLGYCEVEPNNEKAFAAYDALRAALEQPGLEPVKLGSEWVPCIKLPVVVHVRNQRSGEQHVSTREGITPVKPDDLIMRGVSGEEYPIGRSIFEQTYTLDVAAPQPAQQSTKKVERLTDDDLYRIYVSATHGSFRDSKHYWFCGRGPVFGREVEQAVLGKNGLLQIEDMERAETQPTQPGGDTV